MTATTVLFVVIVGLATTQLSASSPSPSSATPVLDIADESVGYVGKLSEHSILVDLKPHLQIKNIAQINGVCSYHVFKPNSEEFPFTIDIKDKLTGEAVIEVVRKELEKEREERKNKKRSDTTEIFEHSTSKRRSLSDVSKPSAMILDCATRKEFTFLIQAHDCSTPSKASNKIPVKIQVVDNDDYPLRFVEQPTSRIYKKTLIDLSNSTNTNSKYDKFMRVSARDQDCTNNGQACAYKLVEKSSFGPTHSIYTPDAVEVDPAQYAFRIDSQGQLSATRPVRASEVFEFYVRAYDCVSKEKFTDAKVIIDVIKECVPEWIDFAGAVNAHRTSTETSVFAALKASSCDHKYHNAFLSDEARCEIDQVDTKVSFRLDATLKAQCTRASKCSNLNDLNPQARPAVVEQAFPFPAVKEVTPTRTVLYSAANKGSGGQLFERNKRRNQQAKYKTETDDDTIEDDESENDGEEENLKPAYESNLVVKSKEVLGEPIKYSSFSRDDKRNNEAAKLIDTFPSGQKFGNKFSLSVWLRRPAQADRSTKEQVFCGTDSHVMNRHHYGLYFYRGNFKFLMRKEPSHLSKEQQIKAEGAEEEKFYPSLWEWSLAEEAGLLQDQKWHSYEVRVNYPNASLFIDGKQFKETQTNSDIIDAYELSDVKDSGPITTYVGACYHARSQALFDHFEGDIAELILTRYPQSSSLSSKPADVTADNNKQADCKTACNEFIDLNMVGNENYLSAIRGEKTQFELNMRTSGLEDMTQLIRKVNYMNHGGEELAEGKGGKRSVRLESRVRCANGGRTIELKPVEVQIKLDKHRQEYNVQLETNGVEQLFTDKSELASGLEPFKDLSIVKIPINQMEADSETSDEYYDDDEDYEDDENGNGGKVQLAKCSIKIWPQRNLMAPQVNSEKVMFLQNLLDEFDLKFEETISSVIVSGVQSARNYEHFLRRLTYVIGNVKEISDHTRLDLIKQKKFFVTCYRDEPKIETNTIEIRLNMTRPTVEQPQRSARGHVAHKQVNRFVVSDEAPRHERLVGGDSNVFNQNSEKSKTSDDGGAQKLSPLTIATIVLCSCVIGFILVFGVIKIHTVRFFTPSHRGNGNKATKNGFAAVNAADAATENPNNNANTCVGMEWDDSGLNITENPLDALAKKAKANQKAVMNMNNEADYEVDELDDDDDEELGGENEEYTSGSEAEEEEYDDHYEHEQDEEEGELDDEENDYEDDEDENDDDEDDDDYKNDSRHRDHAVYTSGGEEPSKLEWDDTSLSQDQQQQSSSNNNINNSTQRNFHRQHQLLVNDVNEVNIIQQQQQQRNSNKASTSSSSLNNKLA